MDGWERQFCGQQVVAIGDVHGDLDALLRILAGMELIDASGCWQGGRSNVVLLGDLNDRGCDSFAVSDFVMSLQPQAAQAGGDRMALTERNRPLLWLHLTDRAAGVEQLLAAAATLAGRDRE